MADESLCQTTDESNFLRAESPVVACGIQDLCTALKESLGRHTELDEGLVSRGPTIRFPHQYVFDEMPVRFVHDSSTTDKRHGSAFKEVGARCCLTMRHSAGGRYLVPV